MDVDPVWGARNVSATVAVWKDAGGAAGGRKRGRRRGACQKGSDEKFTHDQAFHLLRRFLLLGR